MIRTMGSNLKLTVVYDGIKTANRRTRYIRWPHFDLTGNVKRTVFRNQIGKRGVQR